jgi:hypothetical protein
MKFYRGDNVFILSKEIEGVVIRETGEGFYRVDTAYPTTVHIIAENDLVLRNDPDYMTWEVE